MDYAGSHECARGMALRVPEEMQPPPEGICPGHYLRMALRIASFDGVAIRRAARDPDALAYGGVFSMVGATFTFLVGALHGMLNREGATAGTLFWGLLLGLVFVWVEMGLVALIQISLCHAVARIFLGGTGTLAGVFRAALLGWFVNCLAIIPKVGVVIALIAWTAVLMTVLVEVDGLSRLRALLVACGINGAYGALLWTALHFVR